ncbi:hypothetical protein [Pelagibacterium montanilacus]|uniref:hypothetical protein n=1 Tax=Pelagibacterium montanilacus TaxID=2185280 RepID=UPI000F8C5D12|nr:hypothetical protein [Pelagibacterium montanilacus]
MSEADRIAAPASDPFAFFEVVRFASAAALEYAAIDGLEGYVAGKGDPPDDEIAVFFYDIERVWCVPAAFCTSMGRIDEQERAHSQWAQAQIEKRRRNDDAQK